MSDLDLADLCKEPSRIALWTKVIEERRVKTVAEVGVSRGVFAEALLSRCSGVTTYYLIDPWRHLENWNKPANKDDGAFDEYFDEALNRTAPWKDKRVVLRGCTTEVIDSIPDGSLDLAYVDGDHTLHGISIDLIRAWPKVRPGGLLGGDDFTPTIWQHRKNFEPTLVFPFAVYFAEAMGAPIAALPNNQFLIHKVDEGFAFHDPLGEYEDLTLRGTLGSDQAIHRSHPSEWVVQTKRLLRRTRNRFNRENQDLGSQD
jgi:methyltransferase family protein